MEAESENLHKKFQTIVHRFGKKNAIIDATGTCCSYRELDKRSNQFANFLISEGLLKGDLIFLHLPKLCNTFALLIGCIKLGIIYSFIDRDVPETRLLKFNSKHSPKLFFTENVLLGEAFLKFDQDFLDSIDEFEETLNHKFISKSGEVRNTDELYVMFTSGSTGFPKGAIIKQEGVLNLIRWSQEFIGITNENIFCNINHLHFDNSVFDIYCSLFNGSTLVLLDLRELSSIATIPAIIEKYNCDIFFAVPTLYVLLQKLKLLKKEKFPKIKTFIFGGEPFQPNSLEKFYTEFSPKVSLVNVYGPTECSCICSAVKITKEIMSLSQNKVLPLGLPFEGFSFRVESSKEFKDDELLEGELILSGKGVGAGYLNDEEKTQESFIKTLNNLGSEFTEYKTGDVVAFDRENQQLWFKGRKDYQVKVNGFRVELEELDAIANTIEGVTQACSFVNVIDGFNVLFLAVTVDGITEEEIGKNLDETCPHFMNPRTIIILDELPTNSNGKLSRLQLADMFNNKN